MFREPCMNWIAFDRPSDPPPRGLGISIQLTRKCPNKLRQRKGLTCGIARSLSMDQGIARQVDSSVPLLPILSI